MAGRTAVAAAVEAHRRLGLTTNRADRVSSRGHIDITSTTQLPRRVCHRGAVTAGLATPEVEDGMGRTVRVQVVNGVSGVAFRAHVVVRATTPARVAEATPTSAVQVRHLVVTAAAADVPPHQTTLVHRLRLTGLLCMYMALMFAHATITIGRACAWRTAAAW
jgi:hypothetical protein